MKNKSWTVTLDGKSRARALSADHSGPETELIRRAQAYLHDITPPDIAIPANAKLTISLTNWPTYDVGESDESIRAENEALAKREARKPRRARA